MELSDGFTHSYGGLPGVCMAEVFACGLIDKNFAQGGRGFLDLSIYSFLTTFIVRRGMHDHSPILLAIKSDRLFC
jgi:hypothetical protein